MKENIYFYPDCIFNLDNISSSTFLFFQNKIFSTSHPTLLQHTTGCDIIKFFRLAEDGNYSFRWKLFANFENTRLINENLERTTDVLKPFYNKDIIKYALLIYPRNKFTFDYVDVIIKKSKMSINQIFNCINKSMACQELSAHIFYDMFLHFYRDEVSNGLVDEHGVFVRFINDKIDYKLLLDYCEDLFSNYSGEEILVRSYLCRLISLVCYDKVFISNNKLIPFLKSIAPNEPIEQSKHYDTLGIISWEIFRQLTDKYLNQMKQRDRVKRVIDLKDNSSEEITTLKNKCFKLAEQFKGEKNIELLETNIAKHIKIHTSKDIEDLLRLEKRIFENILDSIFSDYKSWLGFSSFLTSLLTENPLFTASAGIAAVASIGSKAYNQVCEVDKKIKDSEYSLIYRMKD